MSSQYQISNPYHSQGLAAGGSALLDAINKGKVHLAKFILEAGERDIVNTRDFKGKTPLIRACYIKEEKTRGKAVGLLLSKGACVNIQDNEGRTALSYACELRCNDVVKTLVQNNVNPDLPDYKGNTPLMYSSMVGNDTAIEILAKCFRRLGLNVDHVNDSGMTALLIAAKNGFLECASILSLQARACNQIRDPASGYTAEQWARLQASGRDLLALWRQPSKDNPPGQFQLYTDLMRRSEKDRRKADHHVTALVADASHLDDAGADEYGNDGCDDDDDDEDDDDNISRYLAGVGIVNNRDDVTEHRLLMEDEMPMLKKQNSLPAIKFSCPSPSSGSRTFPNIATTPPNRAAGTLSDTLLHPEIGQAEDEEREIATVGTQTYSGDPSRCQSAGVICGRQLEEHRRSAAGSRSESDRTSACSGARSEVNDAGVVSRRRRTFGSDGDVTSPTSDASAFSGEHCSILRVLSADREKIGLKLQPDRHSCCPSAGKVADM